jgi:RimJ/RimL family protein N-acetyltransferase
VDGLTLETERLRLRPLARGDLDAFTAFMSDPECVRYLLVPEVQPPGRAAELLERWIGLRDGAVGMYAASRREHGAAVGFVGFLPRRLPWGDELEIGWLLLRGQWGRGYATEAARALRDAIPPRRLISLIHPDNAASIRVAAKLGLELERRIELRGNPVSVYASSPDPEEPDVRDEAEQNASGLCVSPFDALGAEAR